MVKKEKKEGKLLFLNQQKNGNQHPIQPLRKPVVQKGTAFLSRDTVSQNVEDESTSLSASHTSSLNNPAAKTREYKETPKSTFRFCVFAPQAEDHRT